MTHEFVAKVRWGCVALIAVGIACLPFLSNGVFFPEGQFIADLILSLLLAATAASAALVPRVRTWLFEGEALRYGDLAMALLVLLYAVSLFYPADTALAVPGVFDYVGMLFVFFALRLAALRKIFGPGMALGFALASLPVNVIGLANGWGQLKYPYATELNPSGQVQIASVFQYHNAYGAFAASVAIGLIVWSARSLRAFVWRIAALAVAGLNVTGLLASGSRGALAIWAVAMLLTAFGMQDDECLAKHARNRFLGGAYVAVAGGVIGEVFVHHAISHHAPVDGWVGIVLSLALPAALGCMWWVLRGRLAAIPPRRALGLLIAVGILAGTVGALLKHRAIAQKLASYQVHQLSVSQRFIFWRDGLRILARNPITGNGYGAWQAMYMRVQSYTYYSTQSHSFVIDTLLNVGIVGFIALVALVVPMFRQLIWPRVQDIHMNAIDWALVAAGWMAFCHSLMDWDMAFLYPLMLFFTGAGVAAAMTKPLRVRIPGGRTIASGIGGAAAIATAVECSLGLVSLHDAKVASNSPPSSAVSWYLKAYAYAPYNENDLANAATALLESANTPPNRVTAAAWLQKAEQQAPYSPTLAANYAPLAYQLGNYQDAYVQAQIAEQNAPYWPSNMSLAISAGVVDALHEAPASPTAAKSVLIRVVQLYGEAKEIQAHMASLPSYLPPEVPYQLNEFSVVSVAAADYLLGHNREAIALAHGALSSPDRHTREVAQIVVLAASHRNRELAQFVKKHPDVQSSYDLLMGAEAALSTP
ncbi:O-antigen ligase family protein [Alicyclobacillus acidocaldarius]|uniref:O-antigen polymerase n=1 Tax=Alicyclobacillus acidocaldarius subsp. acidocaldarius (strain ATCC 27009 / DSM 446 / BCRC 14685 / JCM 5260 / KCTC 1825 / NBRC 15652 / NCIMB 11725 / NRRL B-14509 / 104-IA) TaxID=521098 RepID=C8WRC8_ALIAD|nr:O-antigen ligase family protein [Alicyclobacillus acidocaldarius]ACV57333.1 O-antigen polymerase [Alicyclobacillus acidocaldarius subsp. acidocaldarius DSM 446]